MSRVSVTRVVTLVLVAVIAVTGWVLLGPAELGGPARYAIIEGSSMAPMLTDGDLAIVRANGEPEKGEVALYHDPRLDVDVLHRIVGESGGRFILKGDGNDYLDDARPAPAELEGTLWFSVPGVGSAIEWLRAPLHAGLVVFVLVLLAFAGGESATRRRTRPARAVGITASGTHLEVASRALYTGALVAALLFGLLAVIAFSRPTSRAETVEEARIHEGTLFYSAQVEVSDVYPDGRVDSGETAFLQLVPALDVSFRYRFTAEDPYEVGGTASVSAVVSDGAGWVRRVPVAEAGDFTGASTTVRGTLDLVELAEIVREMKTLTGSLTTTFAVRIEPRFEISGRVGPEALDEAFTPELPFLLDDVGLRVDAPEDGSPALSVRRAESGTVEAPAGLTLGRLRLSIERAQTLATLGLMISLFVLVLAAAALWSRRTDSEHGRIASRFGDRMIAIAGAPPADRGRVTDLADFDSLARIAELYDRVVLHWHRGESHVYLVDDGSTAYRYRTGPSAELAVAPDLEDTLVLPG